MKILIITQNEPFFLAENLRYLIKILPKHSQIIGAVVTSPSPFGKKESFIDKAKRTYDVFGIKFFLFYSFKYLKNIFDKNSKVKNVLKENNISEVNLKKHINHPESINIIQGFKPDLLVSILGNEIFKKPIINLARKGCINLHTALLPKYRGLMPSFWVLKNNEEFTGVSVFFVDEGIDSGPIIVQKKVKINDLTQQQLIKITKKIGMDAIAEAIDLIENDNIDLIENDDSKKTYYSFPKRSDVKDFYNKGKRFF